MLHASAEDREGLAQVRLLEVAETTSSPARLKRVAKWTGRKVAIGFLRALGASVPIGATGVFLIHQFNDTVVDPAKQKVDDNGKLLRGGLDNNADGLSVINKNGVRVQLTVPGTGSVPNPSEVPTPPIPAAEDVAASLSTTTSESTTITEPPTTQTVTTLPPDPQGDAAP